MRFFKLLRPLYRKPSSALGAALTLAFVLLALLGPLLAPYGPTQRVAAEARQGPSLAHPFGTDHLGRDVFSRVTVGAGSILGLAGLGTLLAVLAGTLFGLLSGYRGGLFDEALMRGFDGLLAIPALLLALLLLGTLGPSRQSVLLVIVVVYTPIVARVVRSEVLRIKTKGFVEAARLRGERTGFILAREILPSVLPALSVEAALRFSYAIFLVASLGFLGVGVQPPTPDWGLMVNEARTFVSLTPWALAFPAAAISLLVVGVNLTAEGLKGVLQPDTDWLPASRRKVRRGKTPTQPTPEETAVVALDELSVSYVQGGQRLDVVRDVTLRVEPGQVLGLVGESGSGKSTLALALMRQLPANGRVMGGRIRFAGQDLLAMDEAQLRTLWGAQLCLVPQDPLASLNPSMRVGDQVAESLRRHLGLDSKAARARAVTLLEQVKIADPKRVAASYPHQLSGGMQQRVMIAMALGTSPRFLVLDEPTTGLDVTTEAAVLDLIGRLIRQRETASLYIAHDLGVVAAVADRVAVLYAGELVEEAQTAELYHQPLHPYTQGLLDSVPRPGRGKDQVMLNSMRGQIPSLNELPGGCVFAPRCPLAVDHCHKQRPPLERAGDGRRVRCHRWGEIRDGAVITVQEAKAAAAPAQNGKAVPALEIHDARTHFPVRRSLSQVARGRARRVVKAVDGVSLTLRRGRTLGLVGESGSGKTTLARALFGLVPLTTGTVAVAGRALPGRLSRRDLEVLRQLQLVSQDPDEALNPHMTVGQSLRRPLVRLRGLSRREAAAEVGTLLEQIGLDAGYVHRLPGQLSGGEKQRVAIARAFAAAPALIVCDEPTSALDVSVQARILNLLNRLQRQRASTYLFISHDLAVVGYLSDEIAVIYLGRLMEVGAATDFFTPPHHPYTEALLSAIPLPDPGAPRSQIRLEGRVPSPTDVPTGCPFHTRCPRALGEVCKTQTPPWQTDTAGHRIFCHIPLGKLKEMQTAAFGAKGGA